MSSSEAIAGGVLGFRGRVLGLDGRGVRGKDELPALASASALISDL